MIATAPMAVSPARPELSALLRAARENPTDVIGRLVLADWLEEYGDESDYARAELVRLQCRLQPELLCPGVAPSVVPAVLDEPQTAGLLRQEDRLLAQARAAWLGPLRELSLARHFRRGMLSLEVDAGQTQRLLARELARAEAWAWVEGVELRGVTGRDLGALASCRQLQNVTSLAVFGEVGRTEMRALSRTAWFGGLRELLLPRSRVSDEALALLAEAAPALEHLSLCRSCVTRHGVERLLRSKILDGLTLLDLRYDRLGDAIAQTLAEQARPGRLRHLLLAGNGISARGCRALSRPAVTGALIRLDLSRNPLGPEGAHALADAGTLGRLTRLDVAQCQLTAEGAQVLLASEHLRQLEQLRLGQDEIDHVRFVSAVAPSRLRVLDLSGNPFGEIALARLALCPVPGRLDSLSLADCGVTPASLAALANSEWLAGLAGLDLGGNALGEEGIAALARAEVGGLDALGLSGCELTDSAVARLVRTPGVGRLTCLHLADNRIGPDGAAALARARGLEGLVALDLDGNAIGDEGAAGLIESPALEGLGLLSLRDCDVTDAGVVSLAGSPGLARISRLALAGPDLGPASARALLASPHADSLQVLSLQGVIRDPALRRALKGRFGCEASCWPSSG